MNGRILFVKYYLVIHILIYVFHLRVHVVCRFRAAYSIFFAKFVTMIKNVWPHILFWFFYWAITTYMNIYWLENAANRKGNVTMLWEAAVGSLLYIIPFIVLGYYFVFFALDKIIKRKGGISLHIFIIVFPYVLSIVAAITMMRLIVFPYIYRYTVPAEISFFEPYRIFSLLIEAAFPVGFLMAFSFVKKQSESNEREKNLIREKLNSELQALKTQLNPHFLFNTLNNIYALSRKKSDLAPDVIMKLSDLLSFMLYETSSETITIAKEIKFIEDYIALQKIRFADCLDLKLTKVIDNNLQPIAPLLLLPLVENAFKHGASENHFGSFIHIHLQLENGQLHFIVENSFEETFETKPQNNIGLSSTRRQLELLYSEQKLQTLGANQIFKTELSVNLNSYGKT